MKGRAFAATVAALAMLGFASSAMAASAQGGKVVVGPAGYALGSKTLVIAGRVPVPTLGPGDHVVICHALGQANKNTYVQIAPSAAGVLFGHAGAGHQNGEDIIPPFIYQPNGKKQADNSLVQGQNWDTAGIAIYQNGCAALPPTHTDVCPNIAGVQTSVPVGMVKDAHGNCVTPAPAHTDVGNCVTPAGKVKAKIK